MNNNTVVICLDITENFNPKLRLKTVIQNICYVNQCEMAAT